MNKIFTGLLAAAALGLSATAAQAGGNVQWSIGVNLPPVATVISNGPVYHPGAYYAPAPVYYAPPPVYYAPPVVYRPAPRYYGPPAVVVHRHWGGHRHWDHRGGRYDGRGHGRHR